MSTKIALCANKVETLRGYVGLVQRELAKYSASVEVDLTVCRNVPDGQERDSFEAVFCVAAKGGNLNFIESWVGNPHLRVINEGDTARLLDEVKAFLGIPEPREIERKFLIEMPDLSALEALPLCRKVDIEQTYLKLPNGERARIRSRGEGSARVYFKTVKRDLNGISRAEVESRLTAEEYAALKVYADPERRTIEKCRYCLVWDGQYFEIDVFPFWKKQAFLELELISDEQTIALPEFIKVIREVTLDKRYNNSALALNIPEE